MPWSATLTRRIRRYTSRRTFIATFSPYDTNDISRRRGYAATHTRRNCWARRGTPRDGTGVAGVVAEISRRRAYAAHAALPRAKRRRACGHKGFLGAIAPTSSIRGHVRLKTYDGRMIGGWHLCHARHATAPRARAHYQLMLPLPCTEQRFTVNGRLGGPLPRRLYPSDIHLQATSCQPLYSIPNQTLFCADMLQLTAATLSLLT